MKKRILFVDDEPNVLDGLRRMLHTMRNEWELAFAGSAFEALELLAERTFDVIVSDIRMPQMDGIALLTEVKNRYPAVMRIVLSGQSKQEHILPSVGLAHQYLSKPTSCDELKHTITRVASLRDLLSNPTLQGLVSMVGNLPTLPSIHAELVAELHSDTCSVNSVGEIVSKDPGLTAKLLQLVNSSFFGLPHRVSTAMQAVQFLGIETVRSLIVSYHAFSTYEKRLPKSLSLGAVWRHSFAVALTAREIAARESQEMHRINESWTAGLLYDVGMLILGAAMPAKYEGLCQNAKKDGQPLYKLEKLVFGASHAEVGACLLALWGLPDPIVEAVAYHHTPQDCVNQSFSALTAVYAANVIERGGVELVQAIEGPDPYLASLGCAGNLRNWAEGRTNTFVLREADSAA
jgi:HD-like signal output (HDOD) protein/ActR/RegA family two-component response regulator